MLRNLEQTSRYEEPSDEMATGVVPDLYKLDLPRVLDPSIEIPYEGGLIRVVDINEGLRVVTMAPEGIDNTNCNCVVTLQSGYMMPPTSMMGEMFTKPLMNRLKEVGGIAVFWAPFGRGTEKPFEDLGRFSPEAIRHESARGIKAIMDHHVNGHLYKRFIGGHSLAGQSNSMILKNPTEYGFSEDSFQGGLMYCPVPLGKSSHVLKDGRNVTGVNWKLITGSILPGLGPIISAMLSKRGVKFDTDAAMSLFFDGESHFGQQEILERLFPDSGSYFKSTLLGNSSREPDGSRSSMFGKTIGVMAAENDPISLPDNLAPMMRGMEERGAESRLYTLPEAGHFGPFLKKMGLGLTVDSNLRKEIESQHEKMLRFVVQA